MKRRLHINGMDIFSENSSAIDGSRGKNEVEFTPLSVEKVKAAARAGLAAAATKTKLFADHEEREIQRLSANIINHQVIADRLCDLFILSVCTML